ncbi:MAG: RlmE family RNA methyltransferase [Defluviicoccus sp.]|nr:RlmE family RNA methyltransferase [Defluviicoccus sp.]
MAARDGKRGGKRVGRRGPTVRVKTARGRKPSSTRWLRRQLNDPYVAAAEKHGYRSRAAWKLIEIDDRFGLLGGGARVLDLGAAPGGWTQVAVERAPGGRVLALDRVEMDPVAGAEVRTVDLDDDAAADALTGELAGQIDLVLSDMAISATGHRGTDQVRNRRLAELAFDVARRVLRPGGGFVVKAFHGGGDADFVAALKRGFREVRSVKPAASRPESAELYLVARGFRGGGEG